MFKKYINLTYVLNKCQYLKLNPLSFLYLCTLSLHLLAPKENLNHTLAYPSSSPSGMSASPPSMFWILLCLCLMMHDLMIPMVTSKMLTAVKV